MRPDTSVEISIHAPRTGSDKTLGAHVDDEDKFQSTLPARGATASAVRRTSSPSNFNPRSPHGERHRVRADAQTARQFQSTLPARGATAGFQVPRHRRCDISIHAPRTGSDRVVCRECAVLRGISIHAPRTGSDLLVNGLWHDQIFQSTLPARGATINPVEDNGRVLISIHAPRTGSDAYGLQRTQGLSWISIHAPRTGSDAVNI